MVTAALTWPFLAPVNARFKPAALASSASSAAFDRASSFARAASRRFSLRSSISLLCRLALLELAVGPMNHVLSAFLRISRAPSPRHPARKRPMRTFDIVKTVTDMVLNLRSGGWSG